MQSSKRAAVVVVGGIAVAGVAAMPAGAAPANGGAEAPTTVTKVKVVRGGEAAKVSFTVTCLRGQRFTLAVEVIQDGDPDDSMVDAYYTSTKLTSAQCTGRVQRFTVLTRPEQSGLFSSPDSRLAKGPAYETIGGDVNGIPDVTFHEVPVR